jgi:hypothetical protein
MTQLRKTVEPFGEVNVHPAASGQIEVTATILMTPQREGTQTGIALDGSGSMSDLYGQAQRSMFSGLFGQSSAASNQISPVAQRICSYLARNIDADGGTTCIYWAVGPGGSQIQEIGDLTADEAERHFFGQPNSFGTGTQLLPAVRYFVDRFRDAPWGFYVFLTDGELHDLDEVKAYSINLAREIAAGRRRPVKFILIGLGNNVNTQQMEQLDDLDAGVDVDLWDHKLAEELTILERIFAEVVDRNARVADRGRILAPNGTVLKDYSDTGVPAMIRFTAPANTPYFTLEVNGNRFHQGLSDTATVPPSEINPAGAGVGAGVGAAAATPSAASQPPAPREPVELGDVSQVAGQPQGIESSGSSVPTEDWQKIDLQFDPNFTRPNSIDLERDQK